MYPGIYDTFKHLRNRNLTMGIISNGQFYTLVDVSCLLVKQSNDKIKNISDFISKDFCFLSYQYGCSKPNPQLFFEALKALQKTGIESEEVLYVGNDLFNDVLGASQAGMKTALFTGDRETLHLGEGREEVKGLIPDLVIEQMPELIYKLKDASGN